MRTRRSLLAAVGGVGIAALAGCSEGDSDADADSTSTGTAGEPTATDPGGGGGTGSPGSWRSIDGDAGNTSANTAAAGPEASPTLETVYEQSTVEDILTPPVIDGETLAYLDESNIRAVSLDGEPQWQFGWGGNQTPIPTPALRDGTVYFPTTDALVAVADGSSPWTADLPGQPVTSPIVTPDGVSLLTAAEDQYTIVSYSHDGSEQYQRSWDEPLSRPSVGGSTLYYYRERRFDETQIVAVDAASGNIRWTNSIFNSDSVPVATDGSVYCVRPDNNGAVIVALSEADGTAEWTSEVVTDPLVGTPALAGETLYVATTEGIQAFDTGDGSAAWEEPYSASSTVQGQLRVDGRSVYLADGDTAVAVDRQTGEQRWEASFGTDGDPGVLGICPVGDRVYATLQRRVVALA